jgi:glycerate kinase
VHVLIAPDKFKGSLTANAAALAMAAGVQRAAPPSTVDVCPLADGGEGTVDVVLAALGGERRAARVTGPLGVPVTAYWALLADGTAVIESAAAAGLELVPSAQRNPLHTTSHGVGELLIQALDAGAQRVVIGLGGTATCDGGLGLLQALGARLEPATAASRGQDLLALERVDVSALEPRLTSTPLLVACDVAAPLFGPRGAALGFAPQKGASPEIAAELDQALERLAQLTRAARPLADPLAAGAGAAGGLGFVLSTWCGAALTSGADFVLDAVGIDERLARADYVLSGEGALDAQTLQGKVVWALAQRAARASTPVVVLTGAERLPVESAWDAGITAVFGICDAPLSPDEARTRAAALVEQRAAQVCRVWASATRPDHARARLGTVSS